MSYACHMCPEGNRASLAHPGVCNECGRRIRQQEHDDALAAARRSVPPVYRWARLRSPLMAERVPNWHRVSEDISRMLAPRVVILQGETGVGKTSVATALLYGLLESATIDAPADVVHRAQMSRYVSARDLPERKGTRNIASDAAERASVLVLDDCGAEQGNGESFAAKDRADIVSDILDRRFREQKRTIITTYGTKEQWESWYGGGIVRRYWEMPDVLVYPMLPRD